MIFVKQFTRFPNAGDVASSAIVSFLLDEPVEIIGERQTGLPNLVAIGSILHWADSASYVWGSGIISDAASFQQRPRAVLACRGHLTRRWLAQNGVAVPEIVGDPGIFLPELLPPASHQEYLFGVVPHYVDSGEAFVDRARDAGAAIIDPLQPLETYVARLTACGAIASSSLHGLVFAHAYGIPAIWLRLSDRVIGGGFKFRDYYSVYDIGNVPVAGPNDDITAVIDRCHIPGRIDKAPLREALLKIAPDLRV